MINFIFSRLFNARKSERNETLVTEIPLSNTNTTQKLGEIFPTLKKGIYNVDFYICAKGGNGGNGSNGVLGGLITGNSGGAGAHGNIVHVNVRISTEDNLNFNNNNNNQQTLLGINGNIVVIANSGGNGDNGEAYSSQNQINGGVSIPPTINEYTFLKKVYSYCDSQAPSGIYHSDKITQANPLPNYEYANYSKGGNGGNGETGLIRIASTPGEKGASGMRIIKIHYASSDLK